MIRLALVCLFLLPLGAAAQPWPSLYKVVHVAGDDSLNVRAKPSASSEVIGMIAPDRTGIEVTDISPDGKWARVNSNESSGWASLRFLSKDLDFDWPPPSLSCFGTEPFWSASFIHSRAGNSVTFKMMGADEQEFQFPRLQRSVNMLYRYSETAWPPQGGDPINAFFSAQSCSDNMSEQLYGISIEALVPIDPDWVHFSGCCSISP